MNVSARAEYACLALTELALRQDSGEPVRIRSIADGHGIPSGFLTQILLQLKGAGLVVSTRGAAGGYRLARPPEEITLAEVLRSIDGPPSAPGSAPGSPVARALHDAWREVVDVQKRKYSNEL